MLEQVKQKILDECASVIDANENHENFFEIKMLFEKIRRHKEGKRKYFFISYVTGEGSDTRWIREPMVDEDNLMAKILRLHIKKKTQRIVDFVIRSESDLDEMTQVTDKIGETHEITRREFYYDDRYQNPHDMVEKEIKTLN